VTGAAAGTRDAAVLVGVDVGTTKAKGAAFDLGGRVLAAAQAPYPTHRPRPGWAEQDPDDWWRAALQVLGELRAATGLGGVRAIGVCSQVNTHVFVDRDGRALAPAVTWQDQRCADVAARLDAGLSAPDREAIWGGPFTIDASYLPARAAWLAEARPDAWERTAWVLSPKDHVNLRLTGVAASDPISSIGLAGADGAYLPGLERLVPGLGERLPPLRGFAAPLGAVTAAEAGLPDGCVAAVGTMDAWGNVYGSGLTRAGRGLEVAGTSEIVGVLAAGGPGAPGVVSFPPVDGLRLHAGPTQAGGDALRWLADAHDRPPAAVLADAAAAPPGAGGLVFLPHLAGERAPLWNAAARGAWAGLSLDHDRRHLARAVLEGVACSARHLLEAVTAAAGVAVPGLILSGGAAASDLWCQIKADVLGLPLHRTRVLDTGVLGAALMGGVAAGLLPDLRTAADALVHHERTFEPDPARRAAYDELYAIYRDLQAASAPGWDALAAWRGRHGAG
jgi:xylulokinase